MKILITSEGQYMPESSDAPVVGCRYILEDCETGTGAQNKLAHSLIQEYFKSGCYSDTVSTWLELKDHLKKRLGEGFEAFVYVDPLNPNKILDAKTYNDVPEHVRFSVHKRDLIRGRLKSWADYNLKQRKKFIDNLICEMHTSGVQTKKFHEILEGIDGN